MLQTMLEASSTAVPLSLKTDTQYSEEDVSETWLWTASFFIWDSALFHERVCIVHINNSTSVTCIV